MNRMAAVLGVCALVLGESAGALSLSFEGDLAYHNDVARGTFTLDSDVTNLRIWTDSYDWGTNFDPILAVWSSSGELLDLSDDARVGPGQSMYDSGLRFDVLGAGDYIFTVTPYNNFPLAHTGLNGASSLSDGFELDSETPILMSEWCQPYGRCGMGGHWQVKVDDSPYVVPIPAAFPLLASGLALMGAAGFRRQHARSRDSA